MNALERFSNRAIDYANCRPSYSKDAIALAMKMAKCIWHIASEFIWLKILLNKN